MIVADTTAQFSSRRLKELVVIVYPLADIPLRLLQAAQDK
jgi:hypothetical protein